MVDLWEAEGCARSIKLDAGFDPNEECSIRWLAERTPKIAGIYTGRGLKLATDAELFSMNGERWIARRSGIPMERVKWGVAHELGEHHLEGQVRSDIEAMCNAIAGCLIMPRIPFAKSVRELEGDPHALAERFGVTVTAAAIRIGEVTDLPTAVMTPSWMWIRGREYFPTNTALIRCEAMHPRPGLRKVLLEPRRQALFADAVDF